MREYVVDEDMITDRRGGGEIYQQAISLAWDKGEVKEDEDDTLAQCIVWSSVKSLDLYFADIFFVVNSFNIFD